VETLSANADFRYKWPPVCQNLFVSNAVAGSSDKKIALDADDVRDIFLTAGTSLLP
jgi:hypothetical protein